MIEELPLTEICVKKMRYLTDKNMEVVGVILASHDAGGKIERATVDGFGRVQWWDVDGSGMMVKRND